MPDQTSLLERVRKLLTKAEDPAVTVEEADAYNTKAAELIATYGIDQAMLADTGQQTDAITHTKVWVDQPYTLDKCALLNGIAIALRCKTVRYSGRGTLTRMVIFGYQSDISRVELLYTSLLLQATTQLVHVRPYPGESTTAYRRTWLSGFTNAVYRRLLDAEHHASHQADTQPDNGNRSTALVLADRNTHVAAAFKQQFPHLRSTSRRLSGSGFHDGHTAGQRANIGTTAVTGNRPAINR